MVVQAIALAWWLVALPMKTLPVGALDRPGPEVAADAVRARPPADDDVGSSETEATVPVERVRLRGPIPPDVVQTAQSFLDLPMGAERVVRLHERDYVFVLEWHYHPRGFVGAPTGWHKGVTVYVTPEADESNE